MKKIQSLVGSFATTRAQVISKITEIFLDSPKYFEYIKRLSEENKAEEEQKAKEEAKKPEVINRRIKNILSGSNKIPLEDFLSYLKIDTGFFYDNLSGWKEKYNFYVEKKIILKIDKNL